MNTTKKIMSVLFATILLVVPAVSFAASLNNDPQDYATLRVANNSTNPAGSTTAWAASTNANPGDTVSFAIYYHNTGPDTANNLRVVLSPQTTGNGTTQAFNATVSSDNSNSVYGSATVYLSSAATLSYIPGTTSWYPYNSNPTTKVALPNGQTGAELFGNGLNLGPITYDAQNPWATQGSVTVSFKVSSTVQPSASLPTITTDSATNISQTTATINGDVNPNGTDANTWFEWGTSVNLGTTVQMGSKGSGTSDVSVSAGIWNLTPNTTYYYRFSASSAQGTVNGSILSFTTTGSGNNSSSVPTVTTNSATNISQNNATLNGYVDPNGTSDTVRWFEWGTYASSLNNATPHYNQGSSAGSFSEYISGLSQYNTYYYHAVAQNSQGIVYGTTLSFTVNGGYNQNQPMVTTQAPTNVSGGSATLNGYVNPNGTSDTVRWFEWGTYPSNLNNATQHYNQGYSAASFSEYISGLSQNTTYYYRAVAQNSQGLIDGSVVSFTVGNSCNTGGWYGDCGNGNNVAVVNTRNADASDTYASLNGYVDPNGTTDTVRWFEWGTTPSLGQATQYLSQGNYASSFSSALTGIYPNTTYYYRAVARNSMGTVYGSILSFTTINTQTNYTNNTGTAPTVTTLLATEMYGSTAKMNGLVFTSGNVASNAWFEWGADTSMTNKTQTYAVGVLPVVRYSDTATGLVSGQTYYYRIVAENIYGRVYGSMLSFVAGTPTTSNNDTSVVVNTPTPTRTVTVVTPGTGVDSLVSLSIDGGDGTITAGEKRAYHVVWENKSSQTLQNVVLRVVFPQSMNVESATLGSFSQADNAVVVDVKTLAPKEKGETFIFANADTSITSGQLLVVTANLVYTKANGIQGDAIAYVTHRVATSFAATNSFAASLFGTGSFLPTTLFGWLLLIILVLALVLLGNHVYGRLDSTK